MRALSHQAFLWVMLVIVPERCFIITRCSLYGKYITIKVLYIIIAIESMLSLTSVKIYALTKILKVHPTEFDRFLYIQTIIQIFFVLAGAQLLGYILHFARKSSKNFGQDTRYRNRNYLKKLTRFIVYIYQVLMLFYSTSHILHSFLIQKLFPHYMEL